MVELATISIAVSELVDPIMDPRKELNTFLDDDDEDALIDADNKDGISSIVFVVGESRWSAPSAGVEDEL